MSIFRSTLLPASHRRLALWGAVAMVSILGGCSSWTGSETATANTSYLSTASTPVNTSASGVAGWNGDVSTPGMTATHRSMALGSYARVTNLQTGQTALVQISGRPSVGADRDIELSRDAAAHVGVLQDGIASVVIEPAAAPSNAYSTATTPYQQDFSGFPDYSTSNYNNAVSVNNNLAYNPALSTSSIPIGQYNTGAAAQGYTPVTASLRYLQLGSFRNPVNASKVIQRLHQQGLVQAAYGQPSIEQAIVNGQTYHRVRLGPIASPQLAAQALRQAQNMGHNTARIMAVKG